MPTTKIKDLNMYYEVHGNGAPLVLIVGLGSDITSYKPIINWLAKRYKVIAFDNRGAGRTDKPDAPYTVDMMAEDTIGLMDTLAIKQANILGISMGGRIALALTLNHPERVKHLVLVCTAASTARNLKTSLPMRLMYPMQWLPIFKIRYRQPRYAFWRQRTAILNYDVIDKLPTIKASTLILHGRKDRTSPYERALVLNQGIKDSKLIGFKGGHLFFILGERQRFLNEVARFLG